MTQQTVTQAAQWANEISKMIDDRKRWLASCERMIELLQPEWERFEAGSGHDLYVSQSYADHTSEARKHTRELEALEGAIDHIRANPLPEKGQDHE